MRLPILDNGHRLPQKLLLGLIGLVSNSEPVDVLKVFMYRPEYFGKPFCDLAHEAMMRGLQEAVFSGPGTLDSAVRKAAGADAQISGALGRYVRKVKQRDYQGIDNCIADLRSEGYSNDQIFEATVSAALGAGVMRLQLTLKAFREVLATQAA